MHAGASPRLGLNAVQMAFPLRVVTAGQQGPVLHGCSGTPASASQRLCPPKILSPLHLRDRGAGRGRRGWTERKGERHTPERGVERESREAAVDGPNRNPAAGTESYAVSTCKGQCGPAVCAGAGGGHVGGWAPAVWAGTRLLLLLLDKMSISQHLRAWKRVCCHQALTGTEQETSSVPPALCAWLLCRPFLNGRSSTEPRGTKDPVRDAESQASRLRTCTVLRAQAVRSPRTPTFRKPCFRSHKCNASHLRFSSLGDREAETCS